MRAASLVPVAIVMSCAACFSTLPPHLGEGTDVLAPGRVSLNVAGGAGSFEVKDQTGAYDNVSVGGFEVRLRSGIGAKSELGISLFGGIGTPNGGGDPPFALGGKLSYKLAPLPWLAFVVDAGAMDHSVAAIAVFSGDLAVIVAPYTAPDGKQLYVALKGAFSIPVLQNQNANNVNEAIIVPVGFELPTSKRVRFLVEGGPIVSFAQQTQTTTGGATSSTNSFGGYAMVAFTFLLR
jgi:hypothetical protein